jgi:peptidyl-tRNA hydrolase, PTH2 family
MIKQVIIIRKDLKMRLGKSISQGAHAAIGALQKAKPDDILGWEKDGCTKICVSVEDENALLQLKLDAWVANLPCYLVQDAGRTEFHGQATYTALGIGPASAEEIDKLTGKLPLL